MIGTTPKSAPPLNVLVDRLHAGVGAVSPHNSDANSASDFVLLFSDFNDEEFSNLDPPDKVFLPAGRLEDLLCISEYVL